MSSDRIPSLPPPRAASAESGAAPSLRLVGGESRGGDRWAGFVAPLGEEFAIDRSLRDALGRVLELVG